MKKFLLSLPIVISCAVLLVAKGFYMDNDQQNCDLEEVSFYEDHAEEFISEVYRVSQFTWMALETKKNYRKDRGVEMSKLRFQDVETPPPEIFKALRLSRCTKYNSYIS